MINSHFKSSFYAVIIVFMASCSANKFLAEGERYYAGEEFEFIGNRNIDQGLLDIQLKELVEPDANGKLLGSRPGVWIYHKAGEPEKKKGFRYWLKYKIGKKPVLESSIKEDQMVKRIESYLKNEGYFHAEASVEVKTKKNTALAIYTVDTHEAYKIRDVLYPESSGVYDTLMSTIKASSTLKKGQRYRLEDLLNEQERIEKYLENEGFYYFDDNYLIYEADSTVGDHQIDLTLTLAEDAPESARQIFTISEVQINPDYSITNETDSIGVESEVHDDYLFINNDDYMRTDILTETVVFKKGDKYSEDATNKTRERLMALGTYKFVNLRYREVDSAKLNSQIYLTPLPKKSLRLDLQAITKSNNFVGPALSASFQNRNAFRGAELFELKLNTSYEIQVGGQNDPPLNAYELNLEGSLTIPRLITPFNFNYRSLRFIPKTRMSLGARLQQRVNLFQINSFEARYGFLWQESYTKRHELYPINVSYVELAQTSEGFNERLRSDINLANSLEDQFILGALYEYTFSSKNAENASKKRHHFFFNGLLDISGNLANTAERIAGSENNDNSGRITYSQYSKVQLDFRYFKKIGARKEIATRLVLGAARAYGNSSDVPFIKQFSAGGSNSIRAFRARSLGPGAYIQPDTTELVIDETGDIKIEANVEYRTPIAGVLEGAIFFDAGNIWLWEPRNELKPEGEFDGKFINDMAVGTGVGLRLNFSFFILRFDLAFPLRKPEPDGVNWVFNEINLLDSDWRSDNLLLNIAIGFPF